MNNFFRHDYDKYFYDAIKGGSLSSAEIIIPKIINIFQPKSVIDVGCGTGSWLSVFEGAGIDIFGIDGGIISEDQLEIPKNKFLSMDLMSDINVGRTFDLALCLEVAEHLPLERSESFVENLISLSPVVVFSAAIPGQSGTNHINEQWPFFWIEIFKRRKYAFCDIFRCVLWDNENIEPWYRQNIFAFISDSHVNKYENSFQDKGQIISIVHPALFTKKNTEQTNIIAEQTNIIAEQADVITEQNLLFAEESKIIRMLSIGFNQQRDYIKYLEYSFSWKITRPLRYIKYLSTLVDSFIRKSPL